MTNSVENNSEEKRGRGRPRRDDSRVATPAERPERTPVSGRRDILTVRGKDPAYEYRWVLDVNDAGQRILQFQAAGYEFVTNNEVTVGQNYIHKTDNVGSIVRIPAGKKATTQGSPEYLYLMRIPKDWYDEDQKAKNKDILETERATLTQYKNEHGREAYGSIKHDNKEF